MRKGQYLALETILSLGIGLSLAVGSISLFNSYRGDVLDTGKAKQASLAESQLASAVYTLRETDSGHVTVDLPGSIGGQNYQVSFNHNISLITPEDRYKTELGELGRIYSFSGTADGGSVKVFKNGNEFVLRPG